MLKGRFDPSCFGAVCKEGLPFFLEYSLGFINIYTLKILIYTELRVSTLPLLFVEPTPCFLLPLDF